MKNIHHILLIAAALLAFACGSDDTSVDFGLDTNQIKLGPEGGTKSIRVSADKSWTASTDKPWILVSPANGTFSTECKIRVDSTLVNFEEKGIVTFSIEGQERKVEITREGFPLEIAVADEHKAISLPDYADIDDAWFEIEVESNVPFKINLRDSKDEHSEVNWLHAKEYTQKLDGGLRPRKTKIRFTWDINSKPMEQQALIDFMPDSGITLDRKDDVQVTQDAAPLIVPGRAGDSIAVLAIARNLKAMSGTGFDSSKSMMYWDNLILWEKNDPKVKKDPSLLGRVKAVKFYILNTKMSLPYEVQYLTAVDSLVFSGNENRQLRNVKLGPEITKLTQLRSLTIDAYGISELPAEFPELKNLEHLSLNSNNFQELPLDIINRANFPKLRSLSLNYERLKDIYDLSNNVLENIGVGGTLPKELFQWEELEELVLSFNYFEGNIPDMKGEVPDYTSEDQITQKYPELIGTPKVLPNAKALHLNGNRLTGALPEWVLKHPNLYDLLPYTFIFNQEGRNSVGAMAGFTNVPDEVLPPKK